MTRMMTRIRLFVIFLFAGMVFWPESIYAILLDPTRPPSYTSIGYNVPLILSAIVIAPDRRVVVINGKIAHIGDKIDDYKVVAIEPDHVELDGPNGKLTLKLADIFAASPVKSAKSK